MSVEENWAELQFKEWLDNQDYGYFYIEQSPETFSQFFKKEITKRPDFFVILKGIGIIAIDVKGKDANFERYGKKCFTLDEELEVRRYFSFEQLTRIPVWFVFIPPQQPSLQYWIPFLKVLECEKEVNKEGKEFRIVPVDKCIVLQTNRDKISRIIEQFIT